MDFENFRGSESKKRRRRTTPNELQVLEEEYIKNPLPSASKRAEIADRVGMSSRNVQVWYQNKRQNEKRRLTNNNENEPLTFVETSFDSGAKIRRTTNYFKSKTLARQITTQPLARSSNQMIPKSEKVPPSPVERLPEDIKPTGRGAMNLSSLLCAPPETSKNRALWGRIEEDKSQTDDRATGSTIARFL